MAKARRSGNRKHKSGLVIRDAKIERARPFEWAWDQRVLLGYLNLLIGEEGVGKGNLTAWVAARVTRGELPGDLEGKPRKVAFVGDEDAWDHIWVPRLKVAGADLRFTKYIAAGPTGGLDVGRDADAIREYIKSEGIALTYFDQLLDNLGVTNSWKDKEVRDAINPIRRVAQETNSALLMSMHVNKRKSDFRDRISGTPAFNALSRSSLLIAHHPAEKDRVVLARGKGNYSKEPEAFEFRIEEKVLVVEDRPITTSRITDIRETGLRRDDLLEPPKRGGQDDSQAAQARRMLDPMFANGEARLANDVLELMAAEGFTARVTQEARRALGIPTWKDGFRGKYHWGQRPKQRVVRRRKAQ